MYLPSLRYKHLEISTEAQLVFNLCSLQERRDAFHCDFVTCFPLLPPANEFWGKVMFLHMSVNGEGGLCMMSLSVRLPGPMFLLGFSVSGPIFIRGGSVKEVVSAQGRGISVQEKSGEKRAVRTLLECILVNMNYFALVCLFKKLIH